MSDKFQTAVELAMKVEWEGGVAEAIISYGIKPDDLPEDTPAKIVKAWQRVYSMTADIDDIEVYLEEVMNETAEEAKSCE